MRNITAPTAIATLAMLLVGCGSAADKASYKAGELGNGGFNFQCDDSVACDRYNAAKSFPTDVALGSTFRVRYIPKDSDVSVNQTPADTGVTVGTIGSTYLQYGPDGFAALKAGIGAVTARNAQGSLVEYTTIRVTPPDALVVYDAAYQSSQGSTPPKVSNVSIKLNEEKSLRALARAKSQDLAGSLKYEWTSSAENIVETNSDAQGRVTLVGKAVGNATVTVEGGTFKQTFPVVVTE